jgi:hypothetical protein
MKRSTLFGLAGLAGLVMAAWLLLPTTNAKAQTPPAPPSCAGPCVTGGSTCRDNALDTFTACEQKCRTSSTPQTCFEACASGLTHSVETCADNLSACVQKDCPAP